MSQHEMKVGQAQIFFKKLTNFHIYRYIRFAIVTFKGPVSHFSGKFQN